MTSKAFGLAQLGDVYSDGALSNRNKIINGAMVIDQRNAGAAVTPADFGYTLDRWTHRISGSGAFTVQRDTNVPAGAGFTYSAKATVTTADTSIAADDIYSFFYKIEGHNAADLMWGTAGAKAATLSFWVKSSHAGTYSVAFANIDANRGYAATYTISAADTWEYKTITVPGDTTGTWHTDNRCKIQVSFCLACGTDRTEPAGSWAATNVQGADGTFNWMATSGATFQITGVQLEAGDTATPFEHRSFGQELALCQRYFEVMYADGSGSQVVATQRSATTFWSSWYFKAEKRAAPTVSLTSTGSWIEGTPTVYPSASYTQFNRSASFYGGGTQNVAWIQASAEL
jgi:hypothetical protein